MSADSQSDLGSGALEDGDPTLRAVVRAWWARHGLVMRAIAVLAVLIVAANVVYWGWLLAYATVARPSTLPVVVIPCP